MKKSLLLFFVLGIGLSTMAQNLNNKKIQKTNKIAGHEQSIVVEDRDYQLSDPPKNAQVIGTTINYDYQTNSSIQRRLNIHDDGTMSAGWIMSFDETNTDRGTGFNFFDGSSWGAMPTARIEDEKTGWPDICEIDGHDFVLAHGPADGSGIIIENSAFGNDDWSSSYVPPATGYDIVWPRTAIGGPDGNSVHMIASYYDTDMIGYYRSLDGGATWDIEGVRLDGFGPDYYTVIGPDDYDIAARGETIAIGIFARAGDVAVLKSTDNGESWTRYTVIDFPDQFEPLDPGSDFLDIDGDGEVDTVATTGGSGSIAIDNDGKVHLATDLMWGNYDGDIYFFLYLRDGIAYWNEDMPEGEYSDDYIIAPSNIALNMNLDTIAMTPDPDGNGEFTWAGDDYSLEMMGSYNGGFANMIQLATDENNNVYMTYCPLMEEYYKDDANPNVQHYKHLYGKAYDAASGEWLEPVNLVLETGLDPATENVYATTAPDVYDGKVHVVWQSDTEPGTAIMDSDPFTTNSMVYNSFSTGLFGIGVKEIQSNSTSTFSAYPNPVINELNLDVEKGANVAVYDIAGNKVVSVENADAKTTISMANFAEGTYVVKVSDSKGVSAKKIVKK